MPIHYWRETPFNIGLLTSTKDLGETSVLVDPRFELKRRILKMAVDEI